MKSFLEEYGFAILAAIVVILLIAMSTPVGNLIKAQIMGMVDKFANTADKKLDSSANGEFIATIVGDKLTVQGPSKTNSYTFVVEYMDQGSKKTSASKPVQPTAGPDGEKDSFVKTAEGILSGLNVDASSQYYVVVTNIGTGETFQSNILTK